MLRPRPRRRRPLQQRVLQRLQIKSESVDPALPAQTTVPSPPPLEGETSSGSGEDLGSPEEITFLCAESSCILHAGGLFVRFRIRPQFHDFAGHVLAVAFSPDWTWRLSIENQGRALIP